MDVQLYVYDLSRGMARQYSMALAGVQIDAIYHTAVVVNNVEYFFGQGVHRKVPGSTHHGRPMKTIGFGKTELPLDVIEEYVESLEDIYTPESYDLFLHNCNNFSQDLMMFLVGQNIPEEIRTLPETFLKTPIGQMLRTQLDQSMRSMTQAPDAASGRSVAARHNGQTKKRAGSSSGIINGVQAVSSPARVHVVSSTTELDRLLRAAESTCAVIFFTSATCPPCKPMYPIFDELAEEAGSKATLIKVDIGQAYDIGMRYHVRATPTFMTFLRGKKEDEWAGANAAQLRGNVRLLIQMAQPQHPHFRLQLPSFQKAISTPVLYRKCPPMDKLVTKLGVTAQEPSVQGLMKYIKTRETAGLSQAALPDLRAFQSFLTSSFHKLPTETHFALIDLVRIAAFDSRVSNFMMTDSGWPILLALMPVDKDFSTTPYSVQITTLQFACNLFSSQLFQERLLDESQADLRKMVENLASSTLLAENKNARSSAAALVCNLAMFDHNERIEGRADKMDLTSMMDLEVALVQAVVNETDNKETLHGLLFALGLLLYGSTPENLIWELCGVMDVRAALKDKQGIARLSDEPLLKEVDEELLAKGGNS